MRNAQRVAWLVVVPLLVACKFRNERLALENTQEVADVMSESPSFVSEVIAEIEAAQLAEPEPELVALALESTLTANHSCAAVSVAGAVVTVDWSCTIGESAFSSRLEGQTTITVTVAGDTISYRNQSEAFSVDRLEVSADTTVSLERGDTNATITRNASVNKEGESFTLSLEGAAALFTSEDGKDLVVDATRDTKRGALTRTHIWTGVRLREGIRYPILGFVDVPDARAGSINVSIDTFGLEAGDLRFIDLVVTFDPLLGSFQEGISIEADDSLLPAF